MLSKNKADTREAWVAEKIVDTKLDATAERAQHSEERKGQGLEDKPHAP